MLKIFGANDSFIVVQGSLFRGLSENGVQQGLWTYRSNLVIGFWDGTKIVVHEAKERGLVWNIRVVDHGSAFAKLTRSEAVSNGYISDVFEIDSDIQYISLR